MATTKPRINVTLRREQYQLVSRLAKVQKRSRSAVLLDLLETVTPVLERVVVAVEAAQRTEVQAREGLREAVGRAEQELLPHVQAAMGQLDMLLAQASEVGVGATASVLSEAEAPQATGEPRPVRSPRPVTRGPGRRSHGGQVDRLAGQIVKAVKRLPSPRRHK